MNNNLIRFVGLAAFFNTAAALAVIVTITLFYTIGGIWGWINDVLSVLWILSYLPVAFLLYRLNRFVNPRIAALGAAVGIPALLAFAVLQSLLVLGLVRFEETIMLLLLVSAGIGLWLLLNGYMAKDGQHIPERLARLTLLFGFGFLLAACGALAAAVAWGVQPLFAFAGAAAGGIGGLIWLYAAITWPFRFGLWLLSTNESAPGLA